MMPTVRRAGQPGEPSKAEGRAPFVLSIDAPLLDGASASRLAAQRPAAAVSTNVIIDLAQVDYADWFGFNALLEWIQRCPGRCVLTGVSPAIESLIHLNHLDPFLTRYPDVATARRDLASADQTLPASADG